MGFFEDFWNNWIKANICAFGFAALGDLFLSPTLAPIIGNLPVVGSMLGPKGVSAVIVGGYAVIGVSLCRNLGL